MFSFETGVKISHLPGCYCFICSSTDRFGTPLKGMLFFSRIPTFLCSSSVSLLLSPYGPTSSRFVHDIGTDIRTDVYDKGPFLYTARMTGFNWTSRLLDLSYRSFPCFTPCMRRFTVNVFQNKLRIHKGEI